MKWHDWLAVALLPLFWFYVSPIILQDMWAWFVVPLGVPAVEHWHAFGLITLVGFLKVKGTDFRIERIAQKTADKDDPNVLFGLYLVELFCWGLGYLAS